jgi:peptidyl-prolyl cis-trans isomerase C
MEISVNGIIIPEREIARETQHHPAPSLEGARRKAAQALAIRALLLQEADRVAAPREGHETDESRITALIEREVKTPSADEATCRRYYQSNLARFRSADLFEARHILFIVKPDDSAAAAAAVARAKAEDAIGVLKQHPEKFAELACLHSACPSGKQGGNLGQVTRGSTVPEVETFLLQLEPGQLCPVPIRSRYGYHVLRLERRVEGRQLPFEAVQEKIAAYLEERVWRQAVRQYIQILAACADIQGIDLKAAVSPLVQ